MGWITELEIFDARSHVLQRGGYEGDPNPDWNRLRERAPVTTLGRELEASMQRGRLLKVLSGLLTTRHRDPSRFAEHEDPVALGAAAGKGLLDACRRLGEVTGPPGEAGELHVGFALVAAISRFRGERQGL